MPRGITSKGLATRQRIVDGAALVLRERGVAATGLEDIRAETGTSSSQLFHYFPGGKTELMLAVAAHEADQILLEQPQLDDLKSWKSWRAWAAQFLAQHEAQREHCGLSALTGQMDRNDPAVRRIIVAMYERWGGAFAAGIRAMQAKGEFSAALDPEQASAALLAGIQGGVVMMLATGSSLHLKAALDSGLERLRT